MATVEAGQPLRFVCPDDVVVNCVSGTAWITIAADIRDIVLHAGQSHVATRRDRLFINAMPRCVLWIESAPVPCDRPRFPRGGRRRRGGRAMR